MAYTSEQLNNDISDAIKTGRLELIESYLKKYNVGRCSNPQTIWVVGSMDNIRQQQIVPCGHCLHCLETKVTSWVFRLYAHAEHYKYVYFTTLSYRDIISNPGPLHQYFMNYLSRSVWTLDDYNFNKTYAFHPCLLCKNHYQEFLKRLRSNLPSESELSYIMCGEYGKSFGRPHYHFILFSNTPITEKQIERAWSLKVHWNRKSNTFVRYTCQLKDNYFIPIGRIDHQDLKANGNFDQTRLYNIDGQPGFTAHQCFSYVCKYIMKDHFNDFRLNLAYDSLYKNNCRNDYEDYTYFVQTMQATSEYYPALCDQDYYDLLQLDQNVYDYIKNFDIKTYTFDYEKFRKNFSPFVECSRAHAIGSYWIEAHMSEYQAGNLTKPKYYESTNSVVPQYFLRKTKESIFSMERYKHAPNQSETSCKGSYLDLRGALEAHDHIALFRNSYLLSDLQQSLPTEVLHDHFYRKIYRDKYKKLRYMLCEYQEQFYVIGYGYDREFRDYVPWDISLFDNWCDEQLLRLKKLFDKYYEQQQQILLERQFIDNIKDLINRNCTSDLYAGSERVIDGSVSTFDAMNYAVNKQIEQDYYTYIALHARPDNKDF